MGYLATAQIHENFMYIERLSTIAEFVISTYPKISQQFMGLKKLSFVVISRIETDPIRVFSMMYHRFKPTRSDDDITF